MLYGTESRSHANNVNQVGTEPANKDTHTSVEENSHIDIPGGFLSSVQDEPQILTCPSM